jgi:hypothetical protein
VFVSMKSGGSASSQQQAVDGEHQGEQQQREERQQALRGAAGFVLLGSESHGWSVDPRPFRLRSAKRTLS